jgi:hypothetical protein
VTHRAYTELIATLANPGPVSVSDGRVTVRAVPATFTKPSDGRDFRYSAARGEISFAVEVDPPLSVWIAQDPVVRRVAEMLGGEIEEVEEA